MLGLRPAAEHVTWGLYGKMARRYRDRLPKPPSRPAVQPHTMTLGQYILMDFMRRKTRRVG
jgi:hypothetical protein